MNETPPNLKTKKISATFLVLSNLVPLIGVFFWHWNVGSILLLYWAENLVIGFFHLLKMVKSPLGKEKEQRISDNTFKTFLVGFFTLHYGLFCYVHGIFIFLIYRLAHGALDLSTLGIALASLFVSHAVSFFQNFLGKKEYLETTTQKLLFTPYKRIVVMHVVILLGGVATFFLGLPTVALVVLVILKISLDLKAHNQEHKKGAVIIASPDLA